MNDSFSLYGSSDDGPQSQPANPSVTDTTAALTPRRVRISALAEVKERGEHFAMLTSYDAMTARLFESQGVDVLLVGDSAANTVLGESSTLPITLEAMLLLTRAVAQGTKRALVVADLPFGSYENSPQQAFSSAARFLKEAGAHAVKLEGGARMAETVRHLQERGVPVMAHIGFTPQSEHALGGYKVQGRGENAAQRLIDDALALEKAGAFALVLEMVPSNVALEIEKALRIPTIGIGAGNVTTGQVLVWQDALGLSEGKMPRFVKQFAHVRQEMLKGVHEYVHSVKDGNFPEERHSFQ